MLYHLVSVYFLLILPLKLAPARLLQLGSALQYA